MTANLEINGPSTHGPILANGWRVREDSTPSTPGDSSGSVGQVSVTVEQGDRSEFLYENGCTFTVNGIGSIPGDVVGLVSNGSSSLLDTTLDLDLSTPLSKLSIDQTAKAVGTAFFVSAGSENPTLPWAIGSGSYSMEVVTQTNGVVTYIYSVPSTVASESIFFRRMNIDGTVTETMTAVPGSGFNNPLSGAAVDASGNYYVMTYSSTGGPRIYKFTNAGALTTSWGGSGTATGQFGGQLADGNKLFYSSANNGLYVADSGNDRVQLFSLVGAYVGGWVSDDVNSITGDTSFIYTASYSGKYRRYNPGTGVQLGESAVTTHGTYENRDLTLSSDGQYLLSLYSNSTQNYYQIIRVSISTLNELETYYPEGMSPRRFSTGPNFLTVVGTDVSTAYPATPQRYIFTRTSLYGAIAYYLSLGGILFSTFSAANITPIVFQGWTGNLWDKLKQLCTVYDIQVSPVSDGTVNIKDNAKASNNYLSDVPFYAFERKAGTTAMTVGGPTARAVKVAYYDTYEQMNGTIYNSTLDGKVITVGTGQFIVETVQTTNYAALINQPVVADNYTAVGQYTIMDSSSPPQRVTREQWQLMGGYVWVSQNPDSQTALDISVWGPSFDINGRVGPYRLAQPMGSPGIQPAFSVTGRAVFTTPKFLTLLTGANRQKNTAEFAPDVTNPFMNSLSQAYDRGIWASSVAGGPTAQLKMTVSTSAVKGWGLATGQQFTFKGKSYRVRSITVGNMWTDVSLELHDMLRPSYSILNSGITGAAFNSAWSGRQCGDITIRSNTP